MQIRSHIRKSAAWLVAVLILQHAAAMAEPWPISKVGRASGEGLTAEECLEEAKRKALEGALEEALLDAEGGDLVTPEDFPRLYNNGAVVLRTLTRESFHDGGQCAVKLRVDIESVALEEQIRLLSRDAITRHKQDLSRVGLLLRYVVDGKPADQVEGYDTREAVGELAARLGQQAIDVHQLDKIIDRYSRSEIREMTAVLEDWKTRKVSGSEIDDWARMVMRMASKSDLPELASMDILSLGEVSVTSRGRDAASGDHKAEVKTQIRLVALNIGNVAASPMKIGMASGETRSLAINNAMKLSVQAAATEIGAQVRRALEQIRTVGREYSISVKNIGSERKQMRPLLKALKAHKITVRNNSGINKSERTLKLAVLYKGNAAAFHETLDVVLDELEEKLGVDDTETSGRRVVIFLRRK